MLFSCIPSQIHSITLEDDVLSLLALKRAVDPNTISPSSFLNSWDFTFDPCENSGSQFLGILCNVPLDSSPSRVTTLVLDNSGYEGFVSPAVGNLTELTILNLGKNSFRGPVPNTLVNLRQLQRLTMRHNFLTGPIPAGIVSLMNLEYLDLSGNRLSGMIPSKISVLRRLKFMSLSNNELSGKIPDLTGLWQLKTLDLSNNQLSGNLPALPVSLTEIDINHNKLTGFLRQVKTLKHLKWMDISNNMLSGPIDEILSLHKLVHLNVSFNQFTTLEISNYSTENTQFEVLDAQGNNLLGYLPVNLVTMQSLTAVNLANNQFRGYIPKEYGLKLQRSWRELYLDHNFLTGSLPSQFSHIRIGIKVSLANNCLKCPMHIALCHGGQRPSQECHE